MWPRLAGAAVGVWLMAAPSVFDYTGAAATNQRIIGPLLAALLAVAASEAMRGVRWAVVPLAAWLLVAPFVLDHGGAALLVDVTAGIAELALAPLGGATRARFAGGWSSLWRTG